MERIQSVAESISRIAVYIGGALLLIAVFLVTFEVISRKFFNYSMAGADELAGYAFALSMAWGYAHALFRRSHIRVDAVYARLPFTLRCYLDVIALIAFAALLTLLSYRAITVLEETLALDAKANTPLSTPLWIPQTLWVAGILFFTICLFIVLARSFLALVKGDLELVREIAHGPPVVAEIEQEIAGITQQAAPSASDAERRD
jgi:TRAP-type C4-dicarboxylate transport system permease small subunit